MIAPAIGTARPRTRAEEAAFLAACAAAAAQPDPYALPPDPLTYVRDPETGRGRWVPRPTTPPGAA